MNDHDRQAIAELTSDQLVERAKAALHELEYWSQMLVDLRKAHDELAPIADAAIASVTAALGLWAVAGNEHIGLIETIIQSSNATLTSARSIQATLSGSLDLVDGRSKALDETLDALRERKTELGLDADPRD